MNTESRSKGCRPTREGDGPRCGYQSLGSSGNPDNRHPTTAFRRRTAHRIVGDHSGKRSAFHRSTTCRGFFPRRFLGRPFLHELGSAEAAVAIGAVQASDHHFVRERRIVTTSARLVDPSHTGHIRTVVRAPMMPQVLLRAV